MVGPPYVAAKFMRISMANIPERWDGPNQWYFVTAVTKDREPIFQEKSECLTFQQAFHEVHSYYPFRLAGLVILADHWHGLIRPPSGVVIETVVGAIKQNMLQKIWAHQNRPTIWQARFLDHRIRDMEDFVYHLEYIRLNPVKHGYVKNPEEYVWCFLHKHPFG
jgi:putative transposase